MEKAGTLCLLFSILQTYVFAQDKHRRICVDINKKALKIWFELASEVLKNAGDIVAIIWLLDVITDFKPHTSFPFVANEGYWFVIACYMLAGLLHILASGSFKVKIK